MPTPARTTPAVAATPPAATASPTTTPAVAATAPATTAAPTGGPLAAYRRVFAVPGAVAFTLAGLIGRLSFSMLGMSLLTAVVDRRHSYALAGAVAAAGTVGVAVGMPLLGRLVDRYGQHRISLPAALLAAGPRAALPLLVHSGAPAWALCAAAGTAAALSPNLGGMARARWAHLHGADPELLHRANALEQALDELCYLAGPVLGVLLCSAFFPEAGLAAVALLSAGGGVLFAVQRRTEPPVPAAGTTKASAHTARSPLRTPGFPLLVAVFAGTGVVFGSLEITTLAWAGEHGHQSATGVLLALLAAGSGLSGLRHGLRGGRGGPERQLRRSLAAMAGLLLLPCAVVAAGGGFGLLAVALFVAGGGTAPTMVSGMTLVQRLLPAGALNEGMAFAVSGIVSGISAGSALGGLLAQRTSPTGGYLLAAGAGALALLLAVLGTRRLRLPAPQNATTGAGGAAGGSS
ncbi:MFS transporter [Kitasatospora sp. LaBMicrA B282]|uniref:MFS transporter n=1 Tax=Kitasatospora sp. LaBMicrA B282 TaxID=3420949 RepID=UPI003D0FC41F